MKVMYVEAAYGFGGSLTGLLDLFRALPSHVEPLLVTCFDPQRFVDLPADLQHTIISLPRADAPSQNWVRGTWRYYQDVIRTWQQALVPLVERWDPDLMHANNSVMSNYAVGRVGRKMGVPTLSHQKGFEYPGRLARWLVRRSPFDMHLATSHAIQQHLFSLGLPPHRCRTIYEPVYGPDVAFLPSEKQPRIAMHSMLVPEKGQHVFLEALGLLRRRGGLDFCAYMAGDSPAGEQEYVHRLRRMVEELELTDAVDFVGHQSNVYAFLKDIDISVHAAVEPEPFGRVVAESMRCGLPTIVTADGGPAEYIEPGTNGFVVPRGDAEALADMLQILIESSDLRRRVGQAAHEFAKVAFDPKKKTNDLVDLYQEMLVSKAGASRRPVLAQSLI